ncbi:cardiolipin synthase [Robertkochia flava]|uniref:cardiolipin synthase n=1 Tax=Robertkochia flava TaxID=3447986 RepID=UPI001CC9BC8F|nr:cardiolipin synthase [Robertkochia marina]
MEIICLIAYVLLLVYTVLRILLDTDSTPKTLAYLLLVFLIPGIGIIVYFAFGINYRHRKTDSRAYEAQRAIDTDFLKEIDDTTLELLESHRNLIGHFEPLVHFLRGLGQEFLAPVRLSLLVNGEEKFPEVLRVLEKAEYFIHMEYYAWENDVRGNQIKEVLLNKVKEGVKIRVLYDDFASSKIKKNIVRELEKAGVLIHPKIRVKLRQFANRLNHRDHRKIIIVDGKAGFVGGINISDRYDNSIDTGLYWRDTHVKVEGALVNSLQRHFIVSWNSSAPEGLSFSEVLFPGIKTDSQYGIATVGQMVAGGPIYPVSNIMLSYMRIFTLARERLYITNPYFIPNESIINALCQAAISGVDVRIMVPEKSDSAIVGAASRYYFKELLNAGVRIFLYKKGFVHAKTVVADTGLSVVGTANMDIRSFDLNFEIMSVLYGKEFALQMETMFLNDLEDCSEVIPEEWYSMGIGKRLVYAVARLISAFL